MVKSEKAGSEPIPSGLPPTMGKSAGGLWILGAALQADGETRSVCTASSISLKRSMDYFAGLDVSVKASGLARLS